MPLVLGAGGRRTRGRRGGGIEGMGWSGAGAGCGRGQGAATPDVEKQSQGWHRREARAKCPNNPRAPIARESIFY
jgi:hypothetical protein